MSDYLIARSGSPLHLAVYAYDRLKYQAEYCRTGRTAPLCSGDRGARWQVVGPWADEWESYRKAGLCRHCLTALHKLRNAAEVVTGDCDPETCPVCTDPDAIMRWCDDCRDAAQQEADR